MSNINSPVSGISYFTPHQKIPAGTAVVPQPHGQPIPTLFQPLKIRGVEFQNRIFTAAMCQYSAKDGIVTPWHLAHLGGIVSRGPGLTIIECSAVVPEGRLTPEDVGIWSDEHIEPLSKIVEFAHSQNQKIGIQLGHSGRKGSTIAPWLYATDLTVNPIAPTEVGGWPDNLWAPSAVEFVKGSPIPKELTVEGIQGVVQAFVDAAKRAVEAGFDVIEILAGHGFLLASFLSPTSNKRTDHYGGSFENRIRLTVEVVDAVRTVIPEDMPLFVRISGTEWLEEIAPDEPSWRAEDTAKLALILVEHGVDLLDVSAGGNDPRQVIRTGPGYQVPFAEAAKKAVGSHMVVGAVGGLYSGRYAQGILDAGKADVVFVGRQFQKNPGQVWTMAEELGVTVHWAHQIAWAVTGRATHALGSNSKSSSA